MASAGLTSSFVPFEPVRAEHHAHEIVTDRWCVHYVHAAVSATVGAAFLVDAAVGVTAAGFHTNSADSLWEEVDGAGSRANDGQWVHAGVTASI